MAATIEPAVGTGSPAGLPETEQRRKAESSPAAGDARIPGQTEHAPGQERIRASASESGQAQDAGSKGKGAATAPAGAGAPPSQPSPGNRAERSPKQDATDAPSNQCDIPQEPPAKKPPTAESTIQIFSESVYDAFMTGESFRCSMFFRDVLFAMSQLSSEDCVQVAHAITSKTLAAIAIRNSMGAMTSLIGFDCLRPQLQMGKTRLLEINEMVSSITSVSTYMDKQLATEAKTAHTKALAERKGDADAAGT